MYELEAMNGPLDGKRWPFSRDITIGRDGEGAALPTDRAASRSHARLSIVGENPVLADLGSRNGTIVDGVAIETATRLELGQPFIVGRTMLCIRKSSGDLKA